MVRAEEATPSSDDSAKPICYVNGKRFDLPLGRGEATLLRFLRGEWVDALHARLCNTAMIA